MNQQTMFGDFEKQRMEKPPVRESDPETSKQAAKRVDISNCEMIYLSHLARLGIASAYEVADASDHANPETIRKRAGGLKNQGLIEVVDKDGRTPADGPCERHQLTLKAKKWLGYE